MSCDYLNRLTYVSENDELVLKGVALANNVDSPKTWRAIKNAPLKRLASIPMPADATQIRDWLEYFARGFDGGSLRRDRKWITGEEAYRWLSNILKRDVGIDALPPRKHRLLYGGIRDRILGGQERVFIPPISKGARISFEDGMQLAKRGVSLSVRCIFAASDSQGWPGRIGRCDESNDSYFVLAHRKRCRGYCVTRHGGPVVLAAENFKGLQIPAREEIPMLDGKMTNLSDFTSDVYALVTEDRAYLAGNRAGMSCHPFEGLQRGSLFGFYHPILFTRENAIAAEERLQREYPEADWKAIDGVTFAAKVASLLLQAA
jgi:hypothetical protein